jgi:hypothetical protein
MSPATPTPDVVELVPVFLDTPGTSTMTWAPRRLQRFAQPSHHSSRLTRSRVGTEGLASIVPEQAARQAAARNLDLGTPRASRSPPSSALVSPPIGSRFSVLDLVPLDHLDQVATACSIIFHGEHGLRLEQIVAIKAKEIFEGALAASRAQVEHERTGALEPNRPLELAPGSSNGSSSSPGRETTPSATPQAGGTRGWPPKPLSWPCTRSRARSAPNRGAPQMMVSNEYVILLFDLEPLGVWRPGSPMTAEGIHASGECGYCWAAGDDQREIPPS